MAAMVTQANEKREAKISFQQNYKQRTRNSGWSRNYLGHSHNPGPLTVWTEPLGEGIASPAPRAGLGQGVEARARGPAANQRDVAGRLNAHDCIRQRATGPTPPQ